MGDTQIDFCSACSEDVTPAVLQLSTSQFLQTQCELPLRSCLWNCPSVFISTKTLHYKKLEKRG